MQGFIEMNCPSKQSNLKAELIQNPGTWAPRRGLSLLAATKLKSRILAKEHSTHAHFLIPSQLRR